MRRDTCEVPLPEFVFAKRFSRKALLIDSNTYLESISLTDEDSGIKLQILMLWIRSRHFSQSPSCKALLACMMWSRVLSGGPVKTCRSAKSRRRLNDFEIVFLFCSFVLLLLVSVSLPFLPTLDVARVHFESASNGPEEAITQLRVRPLSPSFSASPPHNRRCGTRTFVCSRVWGASSQM